MSRPVPPPSPFPPYSRPPLTWLDLVADYLLLGAAVVVLVFVIVYAVVFRWYETSVGRSVLGMFASLVGVLGLNTFARISGGDYPFRDVIRVVVHGLAFAAACYLLVTLLREYRRGAPPLDIRERESVRRTPTKETPMTNPTPSGDSGEALVTVDERILNNVEIVRTEDGGTLVAQNVGVPTQVANPARATLRTVAAVLVGIVVALPTVNAVLAAVQSELTASGLDLPGWVWASVNGAIAVVALLSGIVTRVLAIPGVNDWLASHSVTRGLTAIPLKPIEEARDSAYHIT